MLVIGKNPVLETLKSHPKDINKIVLLKRLKPDNKLKSIVNIAEKEEINVVYLNFQEFKNFFDNKNKDEGVDQGVIGFIRDYEYKTLREIVEGNKKSIQSCDIAS